jgi:WD40 repeat protein
MRGHTDQVRGVLHLPGGRRIITCSEDGSLRLWDLESGAQVGDDWRDECDKAAVFTIALSPNGHTVASGSDDGKVRLWDVETGEVIAKWIGHADWVRSVCWSANGQQVVSGSDDGTARVWDVKNGKTVLAIKTGSQWVLTVIYSPNSTKIATGIHNESGVKIWDSKTGELLATLKHDYQVWSVVSWTSDGKRLVSASYGSIRIFDTATWRRVAILEGGTFDVHTLCLSRNGRLLASAPDDQTVRLWNLNKSIPVGTPLQHEGNVRCAAFSADGKLLVTGCDHNMYVWDIYGILKQAGFEDLLSLPNVGANAMAFTKDYANIPFVIVRSWKLVEECA